MNTAIAPQPQLTLALPTPTLNKRKKIGKNGFEERTALALSGVRKKLSNDKWVVIESGKLARAYRTNADIMRALVSLDCVDSLPRQYVTEYKRRPKLDTVAVADLVAKIREIHAVRNETKKGRQADQSIITTVEHRPDNAHEGELMPTEKAVIASDFPAAFSECNEQPGQLLTVVEQFFILKESPNGDLNLWPHNMPWDSKDKAYEHITHNAKPDEFYYITRAVETVQVEVKLNRQSR